MAKKKSADGFNRSEAIREALTEIGDPNAPWKDVGEWIIAKYPKQKKATEDLGEKLAGYVSGQRQKVSDELGIALTTRRRTTATATAKATADGKMTAAEIETVVGLVETHFGGDAEKMADVLKLLRKHEVNQLLDALGTWMEIRQIADDPKLKGDALAKKLLGIMGKSL